MHQLVQKLSPGGTIMLAFVVIIMPQINQYIMKKPKCLMTNLFKNDTYWKYQKGFAEYVKNG